MPVRVHPDKPKNKNTNIKRYSKHQKALHINDTTLTAGDFLTLARTIGILAALNVAIALFLGSYTDIVSSDGPANFILPFAIAIVVASGLGAGWHVVFAMGAQAVTTQAKSTAFIIGIGLVIVGMGTSAWFLASKIGGSTAIQTHQTQYLGKLQSTERLVGENFAKDSVILQATELGVSNLEADAEAEGNFGKFSGKAGYKGVHVSLKNAATALLGVRRSLKKLGNKRRRLLMGARREIDEAARAVSKRDSAAFSKSANRAAAMLADAMRIRLSNVAAGLAIGSAPGEAGKAIGSIESGIGDMADEIEAEQLAVSIPVYVPMDAKKAVTTYPAPLPWIMAILLEVLPLLMLGLLLALPPSRRTYRRGR